MAIIKKEAYFHSSTGKNKIRTLIWEDDTMQPVAVFQIAHGLGEHMDRYDAFARFLAANGFIVCGNDHLGHGKSADSMEDLGFTAEKDGDLRMVDDMHILQNIMKKRYPDLKYFLFGHSMGSFCARVYSTHFGHELDGVIYCGTGDFPPIITLFDHLLDNLAERLGPATKAKKITEQFTLSMNRPFAETARTMNDWLTSDEEELDQIMADPMCNFILSYSMVRDLSKLQMECAEGDWAAKVPLTLPVLMISGANDPVGRNGKSVLAVSEKLEKTGHTPDIILYPDCRHNLLNETVREKIYNDILIWLYSVLNLEYEVTAEAEAKTAE